MHVSWQSGNMCAKNFPLKINITVLFTLLCSEIWNNTTCKLKIMPFHRKLWGNNCFPKVIKFLNIWTYNSLSAALFHKSSHRKLGRVVVFPWAWKVFPYVEWIFQEMHTDYLRLSVSSNWCVDPSCVSCRCPEPGWFVGDPPRWHATRQSCCFLRGLDWRILYHYIEGMKNLMCWPEFFYWTFLNSPHFWKYNNFQIIHVHGSMHSNKFTATLNGFPF